MSVINLSRVSIFCGIASVVLGSVVLLGWYSHWPALVQVHPTFVPMQYNTALAFLVCGFGLLSANFASIGVMGAGAFVTFLSGVTLIQYILELDLGVDQLLMEHYINVETPHPGRMAPNTALCFLLTGVALLIMKRLRGRRFLAVGILGVAILASGMVAFLGYVIGLETAYSWGELTRMAVHTAVGFVTLGVGLVAFALRPSSENRRSVSRWISILTGVGAGVAAILLWQALMVYESAHVRLMVKLEAENVRSEILRNLEQRTLALVRMAERWGARGKQSQAEWGADAQLYVEHFIGFQAIEWVDPAFRVRWVVPLQGNEKVLKQHLVFEEKWRTVLEQAKQKKEVVLTHVINLAQGGNGFLIYVPIFSGEEFEGFILGVFRVKKWVDNLLGKDRVLSGFTVTLFDGEDEIYMRPTVGGIPNEWEQELEINFRELTWRLRVWPDAQRLIATRSAIPEVVLIMGLLVSLLLAFAVYFGQKANSYAENMRNSRMRLHTILDNVADGIITCNDRGIIESFNLAAERIFGYMPREVLGKSIAILMPEPDRSACDRYVENYLRSGKAKIIGMSREMVGQCKDGSTLPIDLAVGELILDKKRLFIALARDITDRKRMEKELTKSQEQVAHADKLTSLGKLVGSVAHEFNNPLYGLGNIIRQVNEEADLTDEQKKLTELGVMECNRMAGLIRRLQDFYKPSAGVVSSLNINKVVDEVVLLTNKSFKREKIKLEKKYCDNLPKVEAVEDQLKQVFLNIIQNAQDAIPGDGGTMCISTEGFDSNVRVRIQDTGEGMSREQIKTIFDPFYSTKGIKGTGLGLSVSYGIIKKHGGSIEVESTPGKGSVFTVNLPIREGSP